MNAVDIYLHDVFAGQLIRSGNAYSFVYAKTYEGPAISLTMAVRQESYVFAGLPPFFDGLLPEGDQLASLLRHSKIDRTDYLEQLVRVGSDVPGAVTIKAAQ